MKIVGIEHRTGNYKGFDYDNYIIHTVNDTPFGGSCIAGGITDTYKVKARAVADVFSGRIKAESDFKSIVGCSADILCDKYGNPVKVNILENEPDDDGIPL